MKRPPRGFTLVEVLVALGALALLALMSWRGLDALAHSQASHRARDDAVLTLQTALAQWRTDLDAATAPGGTSALDWDGRTLRLTRRSAAGISPPALHVVAWTLRADAQGLRWWRWQSAPLATRGDWQQAWAQAAAWAGVGFTPAATATPATDGATALLPAAGWSLGYFRNGAWGPAGAAISQDAGQSLPDGVRLVLTLPDGAGLAGTITQDWVRPTHGATRGG